MEFKQKPPKDEYELMQNDSFDFLATKKYLKPLILNSMSHFQLSQAAQKKLLAEITSDVPIAAKNFLANKNSNIKKRIKFSVYFTWYIAQRINSIENLKRK